jgi:hypothetical protein
VIRTARQIDDPAARLFAWPVKGGSTLLEKERELKEDGRYIIFYTFDEDDEVSGED